MACLPAAQLFGRGRSLEDGLPDTPTNDLEVMQAGLMRMLGMLFVECSQLLPSHNVFQPVPPQDTNY